MKSIFIADAHLRHPEDQAYRDLVDFLRQLPDDLDNLFILGDFFEFWHGYRHVVYSHCIPALSVLRELAGRGIKIYFFAGNHEVSSGPALDEITSYYADDAVIEIDGRRLYLAHGDRLNPNDLLYHLWRGILRHPFTLKLIDLAPTGLTLKIADFLATDTETLKNRKKFIPSQVLRKCADLLAGPDEIETIVIGHFHQERQENFPAISKSKALYILGDWFNDRSYLLLENNRFSFQTYTPSSSINFRKRLKR